MRILRRQDRSLARIEQRAVFEYARSRLHRVKGASAFLQQLPCRFAGFFKGCTVGLRLVGCQVFTKNRSTAAVKSNGCGWCR